MILLVSKNDYKNLDLKVRKLLENYIKFAVAEVPFYSKFKEKLKDINYKNFFKFPITYEQDLINNPFSFVAKNNQVVQRDTRGRATFTKTNTRSLWFLCSSELNKLLKEKGVEIENELEEDTGINNLKGVTIYGKFK